MLAVGCVPVTPPPPPPPPTYGPNAPVLGVDFPDPMAVHSGTGYQAFATNGPFGITKVQAAQATTLSAWTLSPGDALASAPPWASAKPFSYWAPAVHEFAGTWVLYFVAPHVSGVQCIGVATAATVEGPYSPSGPGPLVCETTEGGSIDPSVFIDDDGTGYLLWKNDGNCCGISTYLWSRRLASDGLTFELSSPRSALITVTQGWEDGSSGGVRPWKRLVEAPSMVHRNGRYWLFYSASWWDSVNYAVGYATCTSPIGGCVKPRNGPLLKGSLAGAGPGGAEVLLDASSQLWLVYHSWAFEKPSYASGGARTMRLSRLDFGSEPVLGSGP